MFNDILEISSVYLLPSVLPHGCKSLHVKHYVFSPSLQALSQSPLEHWTWGGRMRVKRKDCALPAVHSWLSQPRGCKGSHKSGWKKWAISLTLSCSHRQDGRMGPNSSDSSSCSSQDAFQKSVPYWFLWLAEDLRLPRQPHQVSLGMGASITSLSLEKCPEISMVCEIRSVGNHKQLSYTCWFLWAK